MWTGRREFVEMLLAGGAGSALQTKKSAAAAQRDTAREQTDLAIQRGDPWMEVSAANLTWNLRQIEARVQKKTVMAVVKANAYGHGLAGVSRALESSGVKHFLVGKLDEARQLRAANIRGRILNFGPFSDADADELVRLDITQNVYTKQVDALDRAARRLGRRAHVQIKVDTGLGRFGVVHDRAMEFIEHVAGLRGVLMEGVFTTLTEDAEFDREQLLRLRAIRERARKGGHKIEMWHAASSAAIVDLPEAYATLDMVRPGIMLYGLYPSERAEKERKLELRPVLSLKTRVAYVKTLRPGESVSYHRAFTATQPERVATLAAGYSDGYTRALAGKGSVLIAGRRCLIVAISSNATIVRLGDGPAKIGDEAVLIGGQGSETISTSEVAAMTGNSVYGVVMGMNPLVPRVLV